MPLKPACNVTLTVGNFDAIKRLDDAGVYNRFVSLCRLSSTRIVPRSVKWDQFSVTRENDRVSLSLFLGDRETFRLGFVSTPDFSGLRM